MSPSTWHWGVWDETLVFGRGEMIGMAIAHGIILGIAWIRYVARPAWRRWREGHVTVSPDEPSAR